MIFSIVRAKRGEVNRPFRTPITTFGAGHRSPAKAQAVGTSAGAY